MDINIAVWIWLAAFIFFVVLEISTSQLVSLWFIIGSAAAFIAAIFRLSWIWQLSIFFLASFLLLAFLRPLARRKLEPRDTPTNADRVIGRAAMVIETIDNLAGTGRVSVENEDWTARSLGGEILEAGSKVAIQSIDGVKLIVYPIKEDK